FVVSFIFYVFFQAEDGIRDRNVTGVQTCALPIYLAASEAENIAIGMQLGMANSAEATKQVATYLATHTAEGLYTSDVSKSAYAAGITLGTEFNKGVEDSTAGNALENWLKQKLGLNKNPGTTSTTPTTPTTKSSSSGSSKTKKTVAETIEEKYKDQLEANKTLQEIADSEYELWVTENQNSASADEVLAKKMEHSAKAI